MIRQHIARKAGQRGQGMTEYIIIVALIAVAAIGVFQFFGQTVRNQAAGIANGVAGRSAADQIKGAKDAATNATSADQTGDKGLGNYENKGVVRQ